MAFTNSEKTDMVIFANFWCMTQNLLSRAFWDRNLPLVKICMKLCIWITLYIILRINSNISIYYTDILYVFTLVKTKYTFLSKIHKTREEITYCSVERRVASSNSRSGSDWVVLDRQVRKWSLGSWRKICSPSEVKWNENLIQNFAWKVPRNDSE
jgi:hypothetical protein